MVVDKVPASFPVASELFWVESEDETILPYKYTYDGENFIPVPEPEIIPQLDVQETLAYLLKVSNPVAAEDIAQKNELLQNLEI